MSGARTILHADMDAFYAAIEQRDHPEWRGRAVIVGGLGPRGVVATASYEARRFGVGSAMPMSQARRRCPDAVYVRPRMDVYVGESRRIGEIFAAFTPLVEPLSLDEAFLDVSESLALFGDGASIARELKARVREATSLTVSVGVATSKYVAKVASDLEKPDGLVVVEPGREAERLAQLPLARLWGAGKVTQRKLLERGWRTIGDIQRVSESELVAAVGEAAGRHYAALCRGIDPRPVVPEREAKSISREQTFDRDVVDDESLRRVLVDQCESVGARLRRAGLCGGTVRLKLRFPPFRTVTRQRALARPSADDLELFDVARRLFEEARRPGEPVRLIGVGVDELSPAGAGVQAELFGDGPRARGPILETLDEIRRRFGDDSVGHGGRHG